ncbi:hypothetical protein N9L68_03465 [bacterium]|nr:hypothetical protein [bacterium]
MVLFVAATVVVIVVAAVVVIVAVVVITAMLDIVVAVAIVVPVALLDPFRLSDCLRDDDDVANSLKCRRCLRCVCVAFGPVALRTCRFCRVSAEMEAASLLYARVSAEVGGRAWRWASLVLQLSSLALTQRFLTAQEWAAAARRRKLLRITSRQWQCLHPLSLRHSSGNQHGPFVLCRRCCFRLAYSLRRRLDKQPRSILLRGPSATSLEELRRMAEAVQRIGELRVQVKARATASGEHQSPSGQSLPRGNRRAADGVVWFF